MKKLKSFIGLTLLGGLTVVLPVTILMILFQWLFALITDFIEPLSRQLIARSDIRELFADVIVILLLMSACFLIGLLIKTSVGSWLHRWVDTVLMRIAPGYKTIRDIVGQFLGGSEETSLLSGQVALIRLYGGDSDLWVTGIVTATHEQGYCTVFLPTAPIPTSGMVYHVPEQDVKILPDVSVEEAMKTVISCGAGSQALVMRGLDVGRLN